MIVEIENTMREPKAGERYLSETRDEKAVRVDTADKSMGWPRRYIVVKVFSEEEQATERAAELATEKAEDYTDGIVVPYQWMDKAQD